MSKRLGLFFSSTSTSAPWIAVATALASLVACASNGSTSRDIAAAPTNETSPTASSALSRNTSPVVSDSETEALVAGNSQFAVDVYKTLRENAEENLFFSPHSISVALAMAYAGARGTTADEMAATLHFTLPQDKLHNAFNGLDLALAKRGSAKSTDGDPFQLHVANSIWGMPSLSYEMAFLDTIASNYGGSVRLADFVADPEAARAAINGWTAEQTEGRVEEILPAGSIHPNTRLVLVNAVYFNAAWATQFDPSRTHEAQFHGIAGDVTSRFMRQTSTLAHLRGAGFQAVRLPCDGNEIDVIAIMPDAGNLDAFEATLDGEQIATIASSMSEGLVALELPKFKIAGTSFSLKRALESLGMKTAFDTNGADFTGISAEKLVMSDVLHKAFVEVDEKGTEAAAATAVVNTGSAPGSDPPETTHITFDRPFVFAVRDRQTGALVFLGRVARP